MILEAIGGILIAFAVLTAAVALAHLPVNGPGRETPSDRSTAELAAAASTPRNSPVRETVSASTSTRPARDQEDPPAGIKMLPLDIWDAITVFTILIMALAAPAVGRAVAVLAIPIILYGLPLVVRALWPDLLTGPPAARTRRDL
ncbi:hypothetical protein [Pseudonocardia hydrocarbonoxydans]|uniref:hypothetical protein n=1 Tax=Pseudonocardia hydrocarbonoxydans TaxID=76726 RepID=UPI0031D176DB